MNYTYKITCSCGRTTIVEKRGVEYVANSQGWTQRGQPYIDEEGNRVAEGWNCGRPKHMLARLQVRQ